MANIEITIEEKKYILEFNRRTIIRMEEEGLLEQLQKGAKLEAIDKVVYYACLKNQPNISMEEVKSIVDSVSLNELGNFVQAVGELLNKSIDALENKGNAHWEVK